MRKASIVLIAALAACAAKSTQRDIPGHITYLPDGSQGYVITCDGFSGMQDCVSRAGAICLENGYKVIQQNDDPGLFGKPILQIHRGMTIRCNTADGLYPLDEPVQKIAP